MRLLLSVCAVLGLAFSASARAPEPVADGVILSDGLPRLLSDYRFFSDDAGWQPNDRVQPYRLNMPLFSDYAEKYRFIYVPPDQQGKAEGDGLLDLPVGSALIKSFGYEIDGKPRLLETRVLLHRADGWLALPYVWNAEQTEARLKVAGARIPVSFTDPSGQQRSIDYGVPNKNQCKECHGLSGAVTPIGPKARNLTRDGQLAEFVRLGLIDKAPAVDYRVPLWGEASASLNDRARGYLDVNCAHCHNVNGSASNSGLFLTYEEDMPVRIGIGKRPVAAGRGSGTHDFDIAPGDPDGSIMIYRLNSLEPGISMPEVGRTMVHAEGVALLSEWIAAMEKKD
ncbi:SO2930 family diheme c-type cytochrome [Parasphingorhabdus sp.]|uniref:SO2930 family diheme c-type cytochrome n=1 Tax=Parasphingorhabdus sp. TaxID=2709688 RepID=UPI00300383FB